VSDRAQLVRGEDGLARCGWAAHDVDYIRYHDEEWGVPLHGDQALFEKLSLEGFQAGLSWITILRRRPAFREAFSDFDIATVAALNEIAVDGLMSEPRIIRNRAKILATISNARLVLELIADDPGAFDRLMWSFAPKRHRRPRSYAEIVATTEQSVAMSTALRKRGFRFVGPTTMHALMQSTGMVDDHLQGCWRAATR
jgi:DNA-3-methyladenine glycosylase I